MPDYAAPLEKLILEFKKLPGIGAKSAHGSKRKPLDGRPSRRLLPKKHGEPPQHVQQPPKRNRRLESGRPPKQPQRPNRRQLSRCSGV